jgi:hypothetical protein
MLAGICSAAVSLALPGGARANVITSNLDVVSSPTIGSGTLGTVTLTPNGANEVDVAVALAPDTYFVSTGGPHHAFLFNLDLSTPYTISVTNPTDGIFTLAGANQKNAPYGLFTYGINCPGCGPGASNKYPGPLDFTVVDASGITIDDFIANPGGFFFSADVLGPNGGSGNIASDIVTDPPSPVPEPASGALLAAALLGLAVIRRFAITGAG